jgi:hypothetical protein
MHPCLLLTQFLTQYTSYMSYNTIAFDTHPIVILSIHNQHYLPSRFYLPTVHRFQLMQGAHHSEGQALTNFWTSGTCCSKHSRRTPDLLLLRSSDTPGDAKLKPIVHIRCQCPVELSIIPGISPAPQLALLVRSPRKEGNASRVCDFPDSREKNAERKLSSEAEQQQSLPDGSETSSNTA